MLWFSMMLMPTGPPAMILVALTDVTGAAESMKMTIAKFLTVSFPSTGTTANNNMVLIQDVDQLRHYTVDFVCRSRSLESYRGCARQLILQLSNVECFLSGSIRCDISNFVLSPIHIPECKRSSKGCDFVAYVLAKYLNRHLSHGTCHGSNGKTRER